MILTTAFSGFRAAVLESGGAPAVVHTGYWGCGAFGGNRVLMSLLQLIAARAAGVQRVVFYTVTAGGRAEFDLAVETMRRMVPARSSSATQTLQQIAGLGLKWSVTDGS